jgi:RNA polymerase sigma-70 factor (ECF subfamily)
MVVQADDATRGEQAPQGPDAAPATDWTPPTWEQVVREHSGRVYRLAYRLTGNSHDAEDLTQEVFVRVFRSLPTYTPGTFEGWLHRITTNLFLDMARRRQRIRFEGLGDDTAQRLRGDEPTPAQAFDDRHLDSDIQAALKALAPEYRAAVVLCDIEGLSYEEIAESLGVKLGTVRSRIHRGRAQLRTALEHRRPRRAEMPAAGASTVHAAQVQAAGASTVRAAQVQVAGAPTVRADRVEAAGSPPLPMAGEL